jgi:hypothetical protein
LGIRKTKLFSIGVLVDKYGLGLDNSDKITEEGGPYKLKKYAEQQQQRPTFNGKRAKIQPKELTLHHLKNIKPDASWLDCAKRI